MKAISGKELARLVEKSGWTLARVNGSHTSTVNQDTMMEIPRKLVSQVREMIAQHNKKLLKTGS